MTPPAIPPPPVSESRGHRRFSVDVQADVTRASGHRLSARTRDVSRTGICLISRDPVPSGEALRVNLVLSFPEGTFSEPLRLTARVVWCTAIGTAFQVGAMFEEMTEQEDDFLDTFLQFLDGTLAPRGGMLGDDDGPPSPDDKDDPFR